MTRGFKFFILSAGVLISSFVSAADSVVYFSATGNTMNVAYKISKALGNAEVYAITPVNTYTPEDLDYTVSDSRANLEMKDENCRPEISSDLASSVEADDIYLGFPVWWGTAPRIIQSYIEKYDLNSKRIHIFVTSGSTAADRAIADLRKNYPALDFECAARLTGEDPDAISEFIHCDNKK